jgi:RimJ/RimL family protein N-acetyltransferase
MTVPTLRTDRLTLRAPMARDARVLTKALNNLEISRWLAVVPFPYGITDAQWFINENIRGRIKAWFLWAGDDFIGTIGLDDDFGYWLAQDAWGQGFATEAGEAVLEHHFANADAACVRSSHFVENKASQNVLTKLGFLDVGGHVQHCVARQADVPGRRMELTRDRWGARNHG